MNVKSVLISIQPKWCELIASGKKTVEVRKTKPKIEVPFKCYIYCTQGKLKSDFITKSEKFGYLTGYEGSFYNRAKEYDANGKVIGEFVCDHIQYIDKIYSRDVVGEDTSTGKIIKNSCVNAYDLLVYLGYDTKDRRPFYAWHISDLVIYDKPRELSEFSKHGFDRFVPWKRPPQSWGYCEKGERNE